MATKKTGTSAKARTARPQSSKSKTVKREQPITARAAEQDDRATLMSPAKVAAIAKAEARDLASKQVTGFRDFIRDQGVIGIGIGLVLGIQVKAVVDTIMASFVNPITELLLPGREELSAKQFMVTVGDKEVAIGWGAIVYSLFTFMMVAIIIYAGYKLLKLDKLHKKKDESPKDQEKRDNAKKKKIVTAVTRQ